MATNGNVVITGGSAAGSVSLAGSGDEDAVIVYRNGAAWQRHTVQATMVGETWYLSLTASVGDPVLGGPDPQGMQMGLQLDGNGNLYGGVFSTSSGPVNAPTLLASSVPSTAQLGLVYTISGGTSTLAVTVSGQPTAQAVPTANLASGATYAWLVFGGPATATLTSWTYEHY